MGVYRVGVIMCAINLAVFLYYKLRFIYNFDYMYRILQINDTQKYFSVYY